MNNLQSFGIILDNMLANEYISTGIILLLVFYGAFIAPKLPGNISYLFRMPLFNLLVIALIVYTYTKNISISLILLVGFIISLQTLNKLDASDNIIKNITAISEEETKGISEEETKGISEEETKVTVEEETKKLIEEETKKLIEEENVKLEEEQLSLEQISKLAEERVENALIEKSQKQNINEIENEIEHSEDIYNNDIPPSISQNNNITLDRGLQSLAEETVTPISRVLVEEELKQNQTQVIQESQLPTPIDLNSFADVNELQHNVSILEDQINGSKESSQNIVTSRSKRGIDINTKCNLCNNKPTEVNNNIEIKAYSENTFSEI